MPGKSSAFDIEAGKRLRRAREALGHSQVEFAASLGIGKQRLNNWETGQNGARPPELVQVFQIHGISPDYVLIGLLGNCSATVKDKIMALRVVQTEPKQQKRRKRA